MRSSSAGELACARARRPRRSRRGCRSSAASVGARAVVDAAATSRAAARVRTRRRRPKCGCTRFTTSAVDREVGRRRVARRRTRASSTASRRGDVTSTNAVSSVGEQLARPLSARSRNPSSMPSNARKNATMSSTTSVPTTRDTCAGTPAAATRATRSAVRVGTISSRKIAVVEQAGEPLRRVEEVERVPGRRRVDDDQVEARRPRAARAASPSPCTPACPRARRRCCGRSGSRGCVCACSSVAAYCVTRSSNVDLVSSISAWQPAGCGARCRRGPTARGRSRAACSTGARARACRRGAWPGRS